MSVRLWPLAACLSRGDERSRHCGRSKIPWKKSPSRDLNIIGCFDLSLCARRLLAENLTELKDGAVAAVTDSINHLAVAIGGYKWVLAFPVRVVLTMGSCFGFGMTQEKVLPQSLENVRPRFKTPHRTSHDCSNFDASRRRYLQNLFMMVLRARVGK